MNETVKSKKSIRVKNIQMILMLTPMLLLFALFCVYPLIDSMYLSLMKYNGFTAPKYIGFANYKRLFQTQAGGKQF